MATNPWHTPDVASPPKPTATSSWNQLSASAVVRIELADGTVEAPEEQIVPVIRQTDAGIAGA